MKCGFWHPFATKVILVGELGRVDMVSLGEGCWALPGNALALVADDDMCHYRFLADGRPFPDPSNSRRQVLSDGTWSLILRHRGSFMIDKPTTDVPCVDRHAVSHIARGDLAAHKEQLLAGLDIYLHAHISCVEPGINEITTVWRAPAGVACHTTTCVLLATGDGCVAWSWLPGQSTLQAGTWTVAVAVNGLFVFMEELHVVSACYSPFGK